jgi:hypothetical protein
MWHLTHQNLNRALMFLFLSHNLIINPGLNFMDGPEGPSSRASPPWVSAVECREGEKLQMCKSLHREVRTELDTWASQFLPLPAVGAPYLERLCRTHLQARGRWGEETHEIKKLKINIVWKGRTLEGLFWKDTGMIFLDTGRTLILADVTKSKGRRK